MKWNKVDVRPEMDVIQDNNIAFLESNIMNPCLVTDGTFYQEAYMWHTKWKSNEALDNIETFPETWEWLWDHRDNPVNQQMWIKFIPTHWVYIKDIKPV